MTPTLCCVFGDCASCFECDCRRNSDACGSTATDDASVVVLAGVVDKENVIVGGDVVPENGWSLVPVPASSGCCSGCTSGNNVGGDC